MSTARRSTLSEIMTLAWRKFRYERGAFTFAASLRHAWTWVKGAPARAAAEERYRTAPTHKTLNLRTMVQSPMHRAMTGQPYAFDRAYRAGRFTSRLGA